MPEAFPRKGVRPCRLTLKKRYGKGCPALLKERPDYLSYPFNDSVLSEESRIITFENMLLFSMGFVFLWVAFRYDYILFHVATEGFSIVVACLIFVLATRTYKFSRNSLLLFLGHAYLAVALLDFFHTLAYRGMGIFPSNDPNTATQLWIAARYLQALALLMAPLLAERISRRIQFWGFLGIASSAVFLIMRTSAFPDCFISGSGLTPFKMASEYFISAILLVAMFHIRRIRKSLTRVTYISLMLAMGTTILSEMAFTLYADVYGVMNGVGHILKILSFSFIYQGVVIRGLDDPYNEIFHRLQESSMRDTLTGLYNRLGFVEAAGRFFALARRDDSSVGLLMMDIDNFKTVNDNFGHAEGDRILKTFAEHLACCSRESDIPCRFGGDEFVILMKTDPSGAVLMRKRIEECFRKYCEENPGLGIGLSIGIAIAAPGEDLFDVDILIHAADEEMYRHKRSKHRSNFSNGGLRAN